ncbi:hypothetical protein [Sorangium sp. So ce861]|uniref:hypothetical protein n=1 Tax=Sorangium sp. So ce861 TaxID=3133323 RepID=UPI003F5E7D37
MAVDANGDVIIAGGYLGNGFNDEDSVDFGGGPLPGLEFESVSFMAKLDGDGNHIWSQGGSFNFVEHMVADAFGDVYVVRRSTLSAALVKVGAMGEPLWTAGLINSAEFITHRSLAVDSAGNAVVALGRQNGPGLCPCLETFYVRKFAPEGEVLWDRQFSISGPPPPPDKHLYGAMAQKVAVNAAGEIFAVGHSQGDVDFGGGVLPRGYVLVKLDPSGEHAFSRPFRHVTTMIGDHDGDIVVLGERLAKLDASGTELWTQPSYIPGVSLAVSPLGAIALAGSMNTALDLGAGPLPFAGGEDILVTAFGP